MFKRTVPAIVLGFAVASYATLTGCATSTDVDRARNQDPQTSAQKERDEYWKSFNDADRIYSFNFTP